MCYRLFEKTDFNFCYIQWNIDYPDVNYTNSRLSEQVLKLLTQQFFPFFTHWSMLRNN